MKGLLIFLLLLAFVINANPQCQPNEVFNEEIQKCEKFCEIGEIFNLETSSCESNSTVTNCPEGQKFNEETSKCENVDDPVPPEPEPSPDPVPPEPEHVPEPSKCKGGQMKNGVCTCSNGLKPVRRMS